MVFCSKCRKQVKELINFKIGGTIFKWCEKCCIEKNKELERFKTQFKDLPHL